MSASQVAFGSTRVMLTLASAAQSVGMAAAHCLGRNLLPRDFAAPEQVKLLQRDLQRVGGYIPQFKLDDDENLVRQAQVSASSKLCLERLPDDGPLQVLERPYSQMLPLRRGRVPRMLITVDALEATQLNVELRMSSIIHNHTPDVTLNTLRFDLQAGDNQRIELDFDYAMETTLRGHPKAVMPFAVEHYRIKDGAGAVLAEVKDNHQTVNTIEFEQPLETDRLQLEIRKAQGDTPAAIFAAHCFE